MIAESRVRNCSTWLVTMVNRLGKFTAAINDSLLERFRTAHRDRWLRLGWCDRGFEIGDQKPAQRGEQDAKIKRHGNFSPPAGRRMENQSHYRIHDRRARKDDGHHDA